MSVFRFHGDAESRRIAARRPIVKVGNAQGLVAVYLDYEETMDLAGLYGPSDGAYAELVQAALEAYPERAEAEGATRG